MRLIDGIKKGKSIYVRFRLISDRLSVMLVRAEPHKGYVTERVQSSAA